MLEIACSVCRGPCSEVQNMGKGIEISYISYTWFFRLQGRKLPFNWHRQHVTQSVIVHSHAPPIRGSGSRDAAAPAPPLISVLLYNYTTKIQLLIILLRFRLKCCEVCGVPTALPITVSHKCSPICITESFKSLNLLHSKSVHLYPS